MGKDFGEALAAFMEQNSLTQQETAERTGVAQPVIGRILKGAKPELPTIGKIAAGLSVDIQIGADGEIKIDPIEKPASIEVQAHTIFDNPYGVHVSMYDRDVHRAVFDATLLYREGDDEPYDVEFKRHDWIPGYVSNAGLLRWAKAYAQRLISSNSVLGH
jgi:transcriptional regulator with XRE-family HTH domain